MGEGKEPLIGFFIPLGRVAAGLLYLLPLLGCEFVQKIQGAQGPELNPAQLPLPRVGDLYAYDNGNIHRVTAVVENSVHWLNEYGARYTMTRSPMGPRLYWKSTSTYIVGKPEKEINFLWPLKTDNSLNMGVELQVENLESGKQKTLNRYWKCSVDGTKTVTVPAGTFDSYVVECYQSWRNKRHTWYGTWTWQYADSLGYYVSRRIATRRRSARYANLVAAVHAVDGDDDSLVAQLPLYQEGMSFTYNDGNTDKVTNVRGARVRWVSNRQTFLSYRNPFIPRLEWETARNTGKLEGTPPPLTTLWPLKVGNKAHFFYEFKSLNKKSGKTKAYYQEHHCSVTGPFQVMVPAGTFDTLRINCERYSRAGKLFGSRSWYYSPSLGHYVLLVNSYPGKRDRMRALTFYQM